MESTNRINQAFSRSIVFLRKYQFIIFAITIILLATAIIEFSMGRLPLGPDNSFGFWDGSTASSGMSQRVVDPYSFSHIIHGFAFYCILWYFFRKMPLKNRFIYAVLIEAAWEILENSPIIINRYRTMTFAVGYVGDSILNSLSDIVFAMIGFALASRLRIWMSIVFIVAIEVISLILIRDNLLLNIIMLTYPLEFIRAWQGA